MDHMKHIVSVVITSVAILLTGCGADGKDAPLQEVSASKTSKPEAPVMPDVVGLSVEGLIAELHSAGYTGEIEYSSNPEQGDVNSQPADFFVVTQSPAKNMKIDSAVTLVLTKRGVPESQTLFLDSMPIMWAALKSAGIACESGLPASEAKMPDEAAYCTTELTLSRWDLDTESSKLLFATQKEYFSEAGAAPSLFGQNWIYHGDSEAVEKMHALLGGTMVNM